MGNNEVGWLARWRDELNALLREGGFSLDVGGTPKWDLKDFLEKEERRSLRAWCGGHTGLSERFGGRVPRNPSAVEVVLSRLLRKQPALMARAAVLVEELRARPRRHPAEVEVFPQTNHARITQSLCDLIRQGFQRGAEVWVEVMTNTTPSHKVSAACVMPMIEMCRDVIGPNRRVTIHVIGKGEHIPIQPIVEFSEHEARNILAYRVAVDEDQAPLWHGTIVSYVDPGGTRCPVGAIFGWQGAYHIRNRLASSDPNVDREVCERQAEFDRTWSLAQAHVTTWAPTLPERRLRRSVGRPRSSLRP